MGTIEKNGEDRKRGKSKKSWKKTGENGKNVWYSMSPAINVYYENIFIDRHSA